MKAFLSVFLFVLLGCSACSSGGARGPVSTTATPVRAVAPTVSASVTLTSQQIATIRAHYADSSRGNGRGRNGGLPPGIARNLQRGKPLPPGIARQYLPQTLVTTLPVPGSGLEYVVAGGKLLLVEAATQVVREILIDALFG